MEAQWLRVFSHVEFKKVPCRPVDFRGQGPFTLIDANVSYDDDIGQLNSRAKSRVLSFTCIFACEIRYF